MGATVIFTLYQTKSYHGTFFRFADIVALNNTFRNSLITVTSKLLMKETVLLFS